jgi:hypothetical protein
VIHNDTQSTKCQICLRMSVVILYDSYDALRDTVYVEESDITDLTIHLFSLSIDG